jgi:error-prone DNA polymerase
MFDEFDEWLCKTNFSFLHGASHPRELVQRADQLGYGSLCINDFDGSYGLARAWRELDYLRKHGDYRGLQLNYGAEIHLHRDHQLPLLLQRTLVLVATDARGYTNLNRLLSQAHRDSKHDAWLALDTLLGSDVDGLFAIQHTAEDRWIALTLRQARRHGLQYILSQDVFFHQRAQKCVSDLLQAIRCNRRLDDCLEHYFPNAERCLHRGDELARLFAPIPGASHALGLARELRQSCVFDLGQLSYRYPREMIPAGENALSWLRQLVARGADEKFAGRPSRKVRRQLEHELELIERLDFADYFLTVWDIVSWARDQGILCQGRGSAANSSVCYVLGITSVNPDQFDLLFERFVSMERGDPPDIDVDFEHERREEVIQYIYRRYGRERAAMVANVVTFRGKGALRAVGKALGADDELLRQMSKVASSRFYRGAGTGNIVMALKDDYQQRHPESPRIDWSLWVELAERLHGFPRHLGIHSGGFMLADRPLDCGRAQRDPVEQGRHRGARLLQDRPVEPRYAVCAAQVFRLPAPLLRTDAESRRHTRR